MVSKKLINSAFYRYLSLFSLKAEKALRTVVHFSLIFLINTCIVSSFLYKAWAAARLSKPLRLSYSTTCFSKLGFLRLSCRKTKLAKLWISLPSHRLKSAQLSLPVPSFRELMPSMILTRSVQSMSMWAPYADTMSLGSIQPSWFQSRVRKALLTEVKFREILKQICAFSFLMRYLIYSANSFF